MMAYSEMSACILGARASRDACMELANGERRDQEEQTCYAVYNKAVERCLCRYEPETCPGGGSTGPGGNGGDVFEIER